MARFELASIPAIRTHQAIASCAGSLPAYSLAYFHQPNCAFNADAPTNLVCSGSLRPSAFGLRRRLTLALGSYSGRNNDGPSQTVD
jgi:hypothetical protein